MNNIHSYKFFENKAISKLNRFKLDVKQINELKKKFNYKNILIIGAAGSIGSIFTMTLLKLFEFQKLYLLDKDENQLTELNRELLLINKRKIKKIEFICNDLNLIKLDQFMKINNINHYLNFAALKHVRSEENIISAKYLLQTNSWNFIPKNLNKLKNLESIFSISTDKAVNPSSLLGLSKRIMELNLSKIKKKNSNLFISTTRFANVSFSNGSILKLIIDRIYSKKDFGIPLNVKRFFITHEEAVSLCFKSMLKLSDGFIIIPNKKILGAQISIKTLLLKILKIMKINFKIEKKFILVKKLSKIHLINEKILGQKKKEELNFKFENPLNFPNDNSVFKIKLILNNSINSKKILELNKVSNLEKIKIEKIIKNFTKKNKGKKISYEL